MKNLSPKERKILKMRKAGGTLKFIGIHFGVTPERIRQIQGRALEKLRLHDKTNNTK